MPFTANPDEVYKGTGNGYFKRTGETSYRDMGAFDLIETTPEVQKSDKWVPQGGKRQRLRTFVNQTQQSFALRAVQWNIQNLALALGGSVAAAVSLSTTADTTSGSKTLSSLASTAGLVEGRRYWVSGNGIPEHASFIYGGSDESPDTSVTLDRNATATGTGVSVTITCPTSFTVFDESQITGAFVFVGDNDVGHRFMTEALNAIITPSGALSLISDGDEPGSIELAVDVYLDDFGNLAQVYDHGVDGTVWVPA